MSNKRIFVSFAIEDVNLRDLFLEQAKKEAPDYNFISIKKPWTSDWKDKYRITISGFDCVMLIITSNTKSADGQLWEMKCAKEISKPVFGIWSGADKHYINLLEELGDVQIIDWNWNTIKRYLDSL